jgi:hypothetical protein
MMQNPRAPECTFCGATSSWSSERADSTEIGQDWVCPSCEQSSSVWGGDMVSPLETRADMPWAAPEPLM